MTQEYKKEQNNQTYFVVGTMGIFDVLKIQTSCVDEPVCGPRLLQHSVDEVYWNNFCYSLFCFCSYEH